MSRLIGGDKTGTTELGHHTIKQTPSTSEIEKEIQSPPGKTVILNKGNFEAVVSTGSLLLDLAISGTRVRGGGIPSGIIVEIYGPEASGKTAILSEIIASAQSKGAKTKFLDPEARLDKEYARIYGVELNKDDYERPKTVTEVFDYIYKWKPGPAPPNACHVIGTDSLAALSTRLELDKEEGDKMGMRRGKEFSAGLRKTGILIRENNWLIACTNQIRGGPDGEFTPGGKGIPFWSSIRIRVGPPAKNKYIKEKAIFRERDIENIKGIMSFCTVKKSIVDAPFRTANVYIVFNYGIDDIRANLQYLKYYTKLTKYHVPQTVKSNIQDSESFQRMEDAIKYTEDNNLELVVREHTIDLWEEIQRIFKEDRKIKVR